MFPFKEIPDGIRKGFSWDTNNKDSTPSALFENIHLKFTPPFFSLMNISKFSEDKQELPIAGFVWNTLIL